MGNGRTLTTTSRSVTTSLVNWFNPYITLALIIIVGTIYFVRNYFRLKINIEMIGLSKYHNIHVDTNLR